MLSIETIRQTSDDKVAAAIRWSLGILFVMTGVMKLVVPVLAEAFSGQLIAAGLPLYTISRWTVPIVEVAVGIVIAVGLYARLASLMIIGIMIVATYVHLVVADPSLFPLQPSEPIIPLLVILLCIYVLWKGAGAGSKDLIATTKR
jgi:uncharacterized membrane protein YphA (DoxX/SURF4 family)